MTFKPKGNRSLYSQCKFIIENTKWNSEGTKKGVAKIAAKKPWSDTKHKSLFISNKEIIGSVGLFVCLSVCLLATKTMNVL